MLFGLIHRHKWEVIASHENGADIGAIPYRFSKRVEVKECKYHYRPVRRFYADGWHFTLGDQVINYDDWETYVKPHEETISEKAA